MSKKSFASSGAAAVEVRIIGKLYYGQNQQLAAGTLVKAEKTRTGWRIVSGPAKGQVISLKMAEQLNPIVGQSLMASQQG